jgi:hypothetical protein
MPGLGKIQRRIVRAFVANQRGPLTTADLIRWSFPRRTEPIGFKHRISAWRAAKAVAVKIGRTYPGGTVWQLKPPASE